MSYSFRNHCLCCKKELNEFKDLTGFMKCPRADDYLTVITELMPKFASGKEAEDFVKIFSEDGWKTGSYFFSSEGVCSPQIPIVKDLAMRLMKHEPVNGAMYHCVDVICKECSEKLKNCCSCGHDHVPTCPVCKTELVPYE